MKRKNIYRRDAEVQRNAEAFLDVVLEYVELLFHFSLRISASPRLCGEKA